MASKKESHWANRSQIILQSTPQIQDPKEVHTILVNSLRALFGDFENHSCHLTVRKMPDGGSHKVECRNDSVRFVRAALSMTYEPSFMTEKVYQLDVLKVCSLSD